MDPHVSRVQTGDHVTYLNRMGEGNGQAILFLHGSGPGVTAWANWQYALPFFGSRYDALAPDLIGFGASSHPDPPPSGMRAWMRLWVDQVLSLLDALGIRQAHLVGNSMGGAVALHLVTEAPERFGKVVLMGPAGAPVRLTPELDRVWGFYEDPSPGAMAQIFRWFTYDDGFLRDRLEAITRARFEAAMDPAVRRSFTAMFPRPRQEHLDQLVVPVAALRRVPNPVLIVHGRDDRIVPVEGSYHLLQHLPDVRLHVLGRCGHWTQIEHPDTFHRLLQDFLG